MRRLAQSAILATAISGIFLIPFAGQTASAADPAPATQPAGAQAQVPVKQVVLFSSGVGYFEHFGTVAGSGSTELRFKSAQINDILKSLVLQDLDKGKVSTITYPSQDPVAKTLRSFQIDITNNPALHDLLNQLRGARVTVILGGQEAAGTILGVERKEKPAGDGDEKGKTVESWVLNLISGASIRPVPMEEVRDIRIEDPQLRDELAKALAALAQARDQDKKPITINFQGQGERRIRVGYVVETPIWKTSYRLVMDDAKDADAGPATKPATAPSTAGPSRLSVEDWAKVDPTMEGHVKIRNELQLRVDSLSKELGEGHRATIAARQDLATRQNYMERYAQQLDENAPPAVKPADGQANAGVGVGGKLQGWAIVENQTDNDWNDVQLSLVSGRPISFIQDLYQPLYVPRPVVQPELYASLLPQTYDGGMTTPNEYAEFAKDRAGGKLMEKADGTEQLQRQRFARRESAASAAAPAAADLKSNLAGVAGSSGGAMLGDAERGITIDPSASVASVASAAKVGELFQYTVGSVSLPRQKSAMIPIITDPLEVERLSIYNQAVLAKNPLNGARVKNTTTKHLLQGPITVLDGGAYAGDAKIDNLPPGQERLISYGIDLQTTVQAQAGKQEYSLLTGKIVKGVLQLTRKTVFTQEYAAENKGDKAKTLVIEHPRRPAPWKLVAPAKAHETTDALYRFKDRLEPAKPVKLTVREELVNGQEIAILPMDIGQIEGYRRSGEIPQDVKDALGGAVKLKSALVDTERLIADRNQKIAQITQEQNRIRDNMKTVAANTDYANRLMKKLGDQETEIEKFQQELIGLQKTKEGQQKELEAYLVGLTVG